MTSNGANTGVATGNLMAGKRGLVMGIANNRSIASGIAKAVAAQGAELAVTYQGEPLKKRVEPLAAELGSKIVLACDVTDSTSMDAVFADLNQIWGGFDLLVHAIAFSDKHELDGRYIDTTERNFVQTMLISCLYWGLHAPSWRRKSRHYDATQNAEASSSWRLIQILCPHLPYRCRERTQSLRNPRQKSHPLRARRKMILLGWRN